MKVIKFTYFRLVFIRSYLAKYGIVCYNKENL